MVVVMIEGLCMPDAKVAAAMGAYRIFVELCRDGCIVGVGSGSTVKRFIEVLDVGEPAVARSLYYATSVDTAIHLSSRGLRVLDVSMLMNEKLLPDVYVDGADEVSRELNLIKGGGGALLREKVLAYLSRRRIYIVDASKLVDVLGTRFPVPLEVVPYTLPLVTRSLESMGYRYRVRSGSGKLGPVVTDNGNYVVDVYTGPIRSPETLESKFMSIPGVAATGIFLRTLVDTVIVGFKDGSYKEVVRA